MEGAVPRGRRAQGREWQATLHVRKLRAPLLAGADAVHLRAELARASGGERRRYAPEQVHHGRRCGWQPRVHGRARPGQAPSRPALLRDRHLPRGVRGEAQRHGALDDLLSGVVQEAPGAGRHAQPRRADGDARLQRGRVRALCRRGHRRAHGARPVQRPSAGQRHGGPQDGAQRRARHIHTASHDRRGEAGLLWVLRRDQGEGRRGAAPAAVRLPAVAKTTVGF